LPHEISTTSSLFASSLESLNSLNYAVVVLLGSSNSVDSPAKKVLPDSAMKKRYLGPQNTFLGTSFFGKVIKVNLS
jgi:hypothetical protein